MADPHASGDHSYHRGSQEISEQVSTFHLVMLLTKWGSLGVVSVILFTTLILSTGNFFTSAIASTLLLIVGIFLLREKKKAH
ncbi:MAG TPA: aa3-type cytochrome c oxidase subunit IV [Brevundimonas sp.]|jgi:hypothetical protein|uniref:aa3-type cytochrome c oxidase subunit IV n=1 Tax=Brevundimonas sp. TaxID=1871086 RepID=UPI002DE95778|nr:aa3-type cytochrome c oxidase subunit IV [Brevundimonas sp.]